MSDEKLPWWEQPGAAGETRSKEQYDKHIAALKEPRQAACQGSAGGELPCFSELEDANTACVELAAKHGYATGHGDTVADMIREFSAQIPIAAQAPTDPLNGKGHPENVFRVWEVARQLTPREQYYLAEMIAGNVGYELTEETEHPDSPHASPVPSAQRRYTEDQDTGYCTCGRHHTDQCAFCAAAMSSAQSQGEAQ